MNESVDKWFLIRNGSAGGQTCYVVSPCKIGQNQPAGLTTGKIYPINVWAISEVITPV